MFDCKTHQIISSYSGDDANFISLPPHIIDKHSIKHNTPRYKPTECELEMRKFNRRFISRERKTYPVCVALSLLNLLNFSEDFHKYMQICKSNNENRYLLSMFQQLVEHGCEQLTLQEYVGMCFRYDSILYGGINAYFSDQIDDNIKYKMLKQVTKDLNIVLFHMCGNKEPVDHIIISLMAETFLRDQGIYYSLNHGSWPNYCLETFIERLHIKDISMSYLGKDKHYKTETGYETCIPLNSKTFMQEYSLIKKEDKIKFATKKCIQQIIEAYNNAKSQAQDLYGDYKSKAVVYADIPLFRDRRSNYLTRIVASMPIYLENPTRYMKINKCLLKSIVSCQKIDYLGCGVYYEYDKVGHEISFVRDENGKWICHDNHHVFKVTEEDILRIIYNHNGALSLIGFKKSLTTLSEEDFTIDAKFNPELLDEKIIGMLNPEKLDDTSQWVEEVIKKQSKQFSKSILK